MRKIITEGEIIPQGYGVAWDDSTTLGMDRLRVVCYPVPLNIIFRVARDFYWRLAKRGNIQRVRGKFEEKWAAESMEEVTARCNEEWGRRLRFLMEHCDWGAAGRPCGLTTKEADKLRDIVFAGTRVILVAAPNFEEPQ